MTKEEAVEAAIDEGRHNYGEEIDVAAVVEALERYGWRWDQ